MPLRHSVRSEEETEFQEPTETMKSKHNSIHADFKNRFKPEKNLLERNNLISKDGKTGKNT